MDSKDTIYKALRHAAAHGVITPDEALKAMGDLLLSLPTTMPIQVSGGGCGGGGCGGSSPRGGGCGGGCGR